MQSTYVDQVVRREDFEAEHPEISIMGPLETHSVYWRAYRDGELLAVQNDLRYLLDYLEKIL
jgi:hypothetical protein